mmetsp:Transcript_4325/g.16280  ORF Transcript_4325/g.16280 Transcript_4325/m.16280 type:complete len:130 (+) Transcript_4325:226-615(+)
MCNEIEETPSLNDSHTQTNVANFFLLFRVASPLSLSPSTLCLPSFHNSLLAPNSAFHTLRICTSSFHALFNYDVLCIPSITFPPWHPQILTVPQANYHEHSRGQRKEEKEPRGHHAGYQGTRDSYWCSR